MKLLILMMSITTVCALHTMKLDQWKRLPTIEKLFSYKQFPLNKVAQRTIANDLPRNIVKTVFPVYFKYPSYHSKGKQAAYYTVIQDEGDLVAGNISKHNFTEASVRRTLEFAKEYRTGRQLCSFILYCAGHYRYKDYSEKNQDELIEPKYANLLDRCMDFAFSDCYRSLWNENKMWSENDKLTLHPIHCAVYNDLSHIADVLIKTNGNCVNDSTAEGHKPVHYAQTYWMMNKLLYAGADINAQNSKGNTCLHHARDGLLSMLLFNGANTLLKSLSRNS